MTQINNQSFNINSLQSIEFTGNANTANNEIEKKLQEYYEKMQENSDNVEDTAAQKFSNLDKKSQPEFEKIIEDFKKYLEADGDFDEFDELKINTVKYLIESGASVAEVKKAVARIKESVEMRRKRAKEVETFKTTQKASNGLTYKQAEDICTYYNNMYKSYGPAAVDVVWESHDKRGGHYRNVTPEEKMKAMNLNEKDRNKWRDALKTIAELEPQLNKITKKNTDRSTKNNLGV